MGRYLNSNADGFGKIVNSEIYVDKTGMLSYTNQVLNTMQGYLCVSRPEDLENRQRQICLQHIIAVGVIPKHFFRDSKLQKTKILKNI